MQRPKNGMPGGRGLGWDGFSNGFGHVDAADASPPLGFIADESGEQGMSSSHAREDAVKFDVKDVAAHGMKDTLTSRLLSIDSYADGWSGQPSLAYQGQDAFASQGSLHQGASVSFALPKQGRQPHLNMLLSSPVIGSSTLSGLASGAGEDKAEVSSLLHILGADLYGALDDEGSRSLPHPPPRHAVSSLERHRPPASLQQTRSRSAVAAAGKGRGRCGGSCLRAALLSPFQIVSRISEDIPTRLFRTHPFPRFAPRAHQRSHMRLPFFFIALDA